MDTYLNDDNKYLIEVGVLLDKKNKEYDLYNGVYDLKYSYYNENEYSIGNLKNGIKEIKKYVKNGVENTYGIIMNNNNLIYKKESVIYSLLKDKDNNIIENFIECV